MKDEGLGFRLRGSEKGEDEGGGLAGGGGAGVLHEASFLLPPEGGIVGEEISDGLLDGRRGSGERSGLKAIEEFGVPFLLSGDDVVHEHRALGCDGFVNGSTTGLADDEVV